MKLLLNSIFLALVLIACESKQQAPATVPGGKDLSAFEFTDVVGTSKSYAKLAHPNGTIIEEGMIIDGLQDGMWITYHAENANKIKTVTNFVRGVINGPYMEFNENGQIEKKSIFLNNQIDGLYTEFKFGRPLKEHMYKEGILDGISRDYSTRGDLTKETSYKDGKLDGNIRQFDEEGNTILEYVYKNGKKN